MSGRKPENRDCAELIDIDFTLEGWPWALGNFSWAEPTAWACLALNRAGYGQHPRVLEGVRLLLDRAADEGGINYGNRRVFGRRTEPQLEPTALMLLALRHHEKHARITSALDYLREQALASTDLEQLCWAKLVLDVYGESPSKACGDIVLRERIEAAYEERKSSPWVRSSTLRDALTILALAAPQKNLFRFEPCQTTRPQAARVDGSTPVRPWPQRLRSALRGLAIEGAGRLRPNAPRSTVHIARAADYDGDLRDILLRQYEAFRDKLPLKGKRVILKPNLVEYHRDKVINTHPNVVAAAIEMCHHEGASEIVVAEGPGHCRNVEHLVQASGLGDVLTHYGVRFADLNHDEPVKSLNLGRLTGLDYLYLSRTIVSADVVISLPKLKTHHWVGATLSLKNLFGTLPGICYGWPKNELHWRGIDNSIVDIALTRTPHLAIVDGILGMEGDGPLNGTPKPLGCLVMGCDLVAVDATCCRLMRLDPQRVAYLVLGKRKRLGLLCESQIDQLGESIADLAQQFAVLPQFETLALGQSA
jgi:uncharacterized protein (DUF362 family)